MKFTDSILPFFADAAAGGPAISGQVIMMVLLFAGMWFLLIAPQRKKQKRHAKMVQELTTGDNIVTNGGIYGVITNVKDDRFVIKIAESTRIEINKSFVQNKVEESQA